MLVYYCSSINEPPHLICLRWCRSSFFLPPPNFLPQSLSPFFRFSYLQNTGHQLQQGGIEKEKKNSINIRRRERQWKLKTRASSFFFGIVIPITKHHILKFSPELTGFRSWKSPGLQFRHRCVLSSSAFHFFTLYGFADSAPCFDGYFNLFNLFNYGS